MLYDENQTAQAEAYASAALAAARDSRVPPLQRYDAAEWGLIRLRTEAVQAADQTTDYGLQLILMDRAATIDLALQDVRGRRQAFLKGKAFAEDRLRAAQGVH